jgi:hypothetical protein
MLSNLLVAKLIIWAKIIEMTAYKGLKISKKQNKP